MPQAQIRNLLQNLVGSGFTVSVTVDGASFAGLKVVNIDGALVFTVTAGGVVNVFAINQIDRVDF